MKKYKVIFIRASGILEAEMNAKSAQALAVILTNRKWHYVENDIQGLSVVNMEHVTDFTIYEIE